MRRPFCKPFISFLAISFVFFSGTWVLADPSKPVDVPVKGMVTMLDLIRPIYAKTAAYGHLGREEEEFTWERTDKADALREAAGF